MIIPATLPHGPIDSQGRPPVVSNIQTSDDNDPTGGWSPIIGIVTAIVGNILISFALNTQRLAHVRLEQEQNAEISGSEGKAKGKNGDLGTIQDGIAEERAQKNKQSDVLDRRHSHGDDDVDETSALIPKLDSKDKDGASHADTSADNTNQGENDATCDEEGNDKQPKSYLKSPLWWIGITLMVIGEAGNFLAYGFAPASIVSPLGVVALISNCLVAPLFLHEKLRKRDLLGVVVAVGGTVTIVLSAQGSNPKLGPDEIWELVKRWEFLVYLGVTLLAIGILMVLSNKYGDRIIVIDLGLVGLFGGYTALSTKGVASLLSYRLWRTLTFPITYVLVAVLVITAILQIKYVNRALQRFDSTRVIPTQFVMFTIFVIVGSAVLYRDFESATAEQGGKFIGGCGLTFLGVYLLTSGDRGNGEEQQGADDGEYGMKADSGRRISLVNSETPPVTPRRQTSTTSQPGTSFSTNSFVSAMSQQSSSTLSTPTPSSRHLQQTTSASAVPTLDRPPLTPRQSSQTPSPEDSKKKPHLTPRPSLSTLFAPSSFSPLTTPLSSGLSVVVADQRGRLARTGSTRGPSTRNALALAETGAVDTVGGRRQSRRDAGSVGRGEGETATRSRHASEGESSSGVEAVVDERPRVGRGATVEVMQREEGGR